MLVPDCEGTHIVVFKWLHPYLSKETEVLHCCVPVINRYGMLVPDCEGTHIIVFKWLGPTGNQAVIRSSQLFDYLDQLVNFQGSYDHLKAAKFLSQLTSPICPEPPYPILSLRFLIILIMPMVRLELATPGLQTQCSNH